MTISLHFPTGSISFQQKFLWWTWEGESVVCDVTEGFRDLEVELFYCNNQFCAESLNSLYVVSFKVKLEV